MATNDLLNISSAGVVTHNSNGSFSGSVLTQYDVLVGGASNVITSVSPFTTGFLFTSRGTVADPIFSPAGGGFITVTGTLTSAEIKALHATPKQVVAAPAAGSFIKVIASTTKMNYGGTNVFVASSGQNIALYYGTTTTEGTVLTNSNLVASANQIHTAPVPTNIIGAYSLVDATALNLYNSVVTEISGNAANNNTITYQVTYQIITI